ncbi:hypothetical protein D9M71_723640 [compost metagenome]
MLSCIIRICWELDKIDRAFGSVTTEFPVGGVTPISGYSFMIFALKHAVPCGWRWYKPCQISYGNEDSIVKTARDLFSYGAGEHD